MCALEYLVQIHVDLIEARNIYRYLQLGLYFLYRIQYEKDSRRKSNMKVIDSFQFVSEPRRKRKKKCGKCDAIHIYVTYEL